MTKPETDHVADPWRRAARGLLSAAELAVPNLEQRKELDSAASSYYWAGELLLTIEAVLHFAVTHDLALPGAALDDVSDLVAGLDPSSVANRDSLYIRECLQEVRRSAVDADQEEHGTRSDLLTRARAHATYEVMRAHRVITDENAGQFPTWNGIPFASPAQVPDDVGREVAAALAKVDRDHGFDRTTGRFTTA